MKRNYGGFIFIFVVNTKYMMVFESSLTQSSVISSVTFISPEVLVLVLTLTLTSITGFMHSCDILFFFITEGKGFPARVNRGHAMLNQITQLILLGYTYLPATFCHCSMYLCCGSNSIKSC